MIHCSTGEIAIGYTQYLSTNHWRSLRIQVAEKHHHTCVKCKKVFTSGYHIHHKTYTRLGNERLSDLAFYCEACHKKLHKDKSAKKKTTRNQKVIKLIVSELNTLDESSLYKILTYIDKLK